MPSTTQPFFDAQTLPDLTFFATDGSTTLVLRESEARIAALATTLTQQFPRGARVGLLYRSEPALPLMWLAALHAGLEPLILQYPTEKQSLAAWRFSVDNTVRSVRLAGLICSPELQRFDVGAYNPLFHTGHVSAERRRSSRLGSLSPDAAVLQMSSGTTAQRKAIRFTLRQLGRHAEDYNATLGLGASDRVVSWLPLYHDMGFIACFVMPMLLGVPIAMIDPIDWVRAPGSLFDAIERVGGTLCFLPNFGFEVMSRHANGRRFPTMRRWISCSEPVSASTLERFGAATGTADSLLSACYAMAENVFAVSQHDGLKTIEYDGRPVVSCGRPIRGVDIRVVDGEVWVRSPYSLSAYVDGERITDADGFYPTGDLGALVDGELLIMGRKNDLVNVAGRKYFLSDLDRALERVLPGVDGRAATVARRDKTYGTELPLQLVEDRDFFDRSDHGDIAQKVCAETDIETLTVEFVPPGFLTKTTSGKINRRQSLADFETAREARDSRGKGQSGSDAMEAEFTRVFGRLPRDRPVASLLDSLGRVSLEMMLNDAGLAFRAAATLGEVQDALRSAYRSAGTPERGDRLAIVSMADGRTVAGVAADHLAQLEAAAGCPVVWENLCLPPTPAVLSDVVFFDHFLPRDPSPKYDAVIPALRALRSASMIIVDDVAELLFGQFAYPVLSHRFERSEAADLLVWRWQRYTERHHELPIGVLNLWRTHRVRNQFIERLGRYLGVPVFRIATLQSFESLTADWEFVSRSNADWTMELTVDVEGLVSRLAEFIARERKRMPLRPGSDGEIPLTPDLPHFCSMYADRAKIDAVLAQHNRFCVIGTDSSVPYVVRKIEAVGKHWLRTNNLNLAGQGIVDADFDCVLQTGSWGRPGDQSPVYQVFTAGWNPAEQPAVLNGHSIIESEFFHAPVTAAPSDGLSPKSVLWPLAPPPMAMSFTTSLGIPGQPGWGPPARSGT